MLISFASHATAASRLAPCTRELRGCAHPAAVKSECPLANLVLFLKIGGFENRPAACASKLNPALL